VELCIKYNGITAAQFGLLTAVLVYISVAAFGGAFLWEISPQVNFLMAFACGLAGTIYVWIFGEDLRGPT
jgi:hypothetical protein